MITFCHLSKLLLLLLWTGLRRLLTLAPKMFFKLSYFIFFVALISSRITKIVTQSAENELRISNSIIQTKNGPVQGIIKNSRDPAKEFVAFMGLRYVDPPKRFEPASPLSKTWTEPLIAANAGSSCPQFTETGKIVVNEDCNFLNLYVPRSTMEGGGGEKLPVMVYFHGGGFTFGDGTSYGSEYFMETEDVILITVNYRLNVFGFFRHFDDLEDDTFPSNLGLRDQVKALEWVKENIEAFKGDPENVTIFGNSAGSSSVHYLLLSPLSKGLFHKAIMQSGATSFWSYSPNPRETAMKLGKHIGCPVKNSKELRKCLEKKSPEEILNAQATFWPRYPECNGIGWFVPTDRESSKNPFFPQKLQSFFTKPGLDRVEYPNKVPVMVGTLRDEGSSLFASCVLSIEGALEKLDSDWNELAPKAFCYEDFFPSQKLPELSRKVREYYYGKQANLTKDNLHFLITLYTDTLFLLPVAQAAIDMAREGLQVYPYVFSYVGEFSLRDVLEWHQLPGLVGHADELQYQFPHEVLGPPLKPDSISEKLSKRFVKMWTTFAKRGDPAASEWTEGLDVDFQPIQISSKKSKIQFDILRIDTKLKLVKSEFTDRLDFWVDLLRQLVFKDDAASETKTEL